jgi:hypothetical protein
MREQAEAEPQVQPAPVRPAEPAAPLVTVAAQSTPEARVHFGSRMRPSLQALIRRTSVDLQDQLGHRVQLERVLEAIMEEFRDDPALRQRVAQRIAQD